MKPRIRYTNAPTEAQERQLEAAYPLLIDRDTSTPARARRACKDVWETMVRNCDYPSPEITRRQMEALKVCCRIADANGGWFSVQRIQTAMQFRFWQSAYRLVLELTEAGYIVRKKKGRYRIKKRPPFALHEID